MLSKKLYRGKNGQNTEQDVEDGIIARKFHLENTKSIVASLPLYLRRFYTFASIQLGANKDGYKAGQGCYPVWIISKLEKKFKKMICSKYQ